MINRTYTLLVQCYPNFYSAGEFSRIVAKPAQTVFQSHPLLNWSRARTSPERYTGYALIFREKKQFVRRQQEKEILKEREHKIGGRAKVEKKKKETANETIIREQKKSYGKKDNNNSMSE